MTANVFNRPDIGLGWLWSQRILCFLPIVFGAGAFFAPADYFVPLHCLAAGCAITAYGLQAGNWLRNDELVVVNAGFGTTGIAGYMTVMIQFADGQPVSGMQIFMICLAGIWALYPLALQILHTPVEDYWEYCR